MSIAAWQAVLIAFLYYLTVASPPWLGGLGSVSVRQPIVAGTIVGIILGEPVQGLVIGATINALFLGFVSTGGAIASEPGIAGVVGTALALSSSADPSVAVTLAVPFGLLGTLIWNLRMTMNSFFIHWLDKAAEEGDAKKMWFIALCPAQLATLLLSGIPVFILVFFGGSVVQPALAMLEGTPMHILKVLGGVLPALGIALTLRILSSRKGIIPLFVLGFYLYLYGQVPMLMLAVFAAIIAYFYTDLKFAHDDDEEE